MHAEHCIYAYNNYYDKRFVLGRYYKTKFLLQKFEIIVALFCIMLITKQLIFIMF